MAWTIAGIRSVAEVVGTTRPSVFASAAEVINRTTPAGARIGAFSAGTQAFLMEDERTVTNLDGLASSPAYLEALRSDRLREFLEQAVSLYERAQTAQGQDALALYREIDVLLPEYKDVALHLRTLRAELALEQP